jgi:hypothetical protein
MTGQGYVSAREGGGSLSDGCILCMKAAMTLGTSDTQAEQVRAALGRWLMAELEWADEERQSRSVGPE